MSARKLWSCKSCRWTGSSPDHVIVLFHKCRNDKVRRRLVELPGILDGDPRIKVEDDRADWFESLFPAPPPPDNRKAPPK